MRRWHARSVLGALTAATALAIGVVAAAAGTDDRGATDAVLREVEASPKKDVVSEMIARSRAAQDRAAKLRASGDETHARLADGLAKTWAEAARDVVRAADVEERAQAARRAATDAGLVAERERALLEEGIAQSGRVKAQLEAVERDAKEQPARTSAAANADTDGGAARPRAPKTTTPNAPSPAPAPARDGGAR
ncbi:MAG TPA: hypothetical protein VLT33_30395 [Labilithrix sp.]|nr:hypothetical protein [Labilithrix sp.]